MAFLKPVAEPLTFWHVAGDIIYLGTKRPIDREMAESLRDLFHDEAVALYVAGQWDLGKRAQKLWLQLIDALDLLDMYGRLSAVSNRRAA